MSSPEELVRSLLAARANEPDRVEFQAYFDATLDALRKGAPGLAEPSRVALSRSVALRCQSARKALGSKLNIDEGPSGAAAILAKFVDFEDRYDADKNVSDDEVRTATAEAKALLKGKAP